jgi:hypothetical protein
MVNSTVPPPSGGPPHDRKGGVFLVVGVLVAIALAAGLLFYTPPSERTDQATQPDRTMERTINPTPDQPRTPAIPREMPPRETPINPPARE